MGKDTRQRILDSARELFRVHGYNGVSLQDIADTVGISKGNLTYHFSKKEEIMEELLSENQPSDQPGQLGTLQDMDALHMAISYWGPFSSLQKSIGIDMEYRRHAWSIIYHLLTEKGRAELKSIIQI